MSLMEIESGFRRSHDSVNGGKKSVAEKGKDRAVMGVGLTRRHKCGAITGLKMGKEGEWW